MTEAITNHLHEMIRDNWGMSMREIEHATGWPRRMLQRTLGAMESQRMIRNERGRYVAR